MEPNAPEAPHPPMQVCSTLIVSDEERSPPPTVFHVWVAAVSAARRVPAEFRLGVRY